MREKAKPIYLCQYKGKCYWQSRKKHGEKEIKTCRMIPKFPNETCNQVKLTYKLR